MQCIPDQVVFKGLEIIMPLVAGEVLKYPKLLRAFFSLLGYVLEVYPDTLQRMPGTNLCSSLIRL